MIEKLPTENLPEHCDDMHLRIVINELVDGFNEMCRELDEAIQQHEEENLSYQFAKLNDEVNAVAERVEQVSDRLRNTGMERIG